MCVLLVCFLTDLYGGLPPQQQLQTLAVVGQAAVVQCCAAFDCLLIQVQTAEGHKERRKLYIPTQEAKDGVLVSPVEPLKTKTGN